jgi:hypothetical protein
MGLAGPVVKRNHAEFPQKRTDDGDRNMPLPQDHSAHTLPVSPKPENSSLQAGKRVAICPFRLRAMDSRPNQVFHRLLN